MVRGKAEEEEGRGQRQEILCGEAEEGERAETKDIVSVNVLSLPHSLMPTFRAYLCLFLPLPLGLFLSSQVHCFVNNR